MKTRFLFVALSIFMLSFASESFADEMKQKRILAQKFFEIRPVALGADLAIDTIAASRPLNQQALFKRQMRLHMDYAELETLMSEVFIDTYTLDEMEAMIEFYGSDVGKRVLDKEGTFKDNITPVLQQMLDKAFTQANYGMNGLQSLP